MLKGTYGFVLMRRVHWDHKKRKKKIRFFLGSTWTKEYIFLRLDKVRPREGTEVKTDFTFREKVFLSEIVGKKDMLSN